MAFDQIGDVIHKEKNQKKHNKTIGQVDNLKKYTSHDNKSMDNLTTAEQQIKREAKYLKNLHLDEVYQGLLMKGLISDERYEAWYFKCLHTLGPVFVLAQADRALRNARDPRNPAPLFHFLLNKAMNKSIDPTLPRFN